MFQSFRPVLNAFTLLFILYQNFNSLPQKLLSDQDKRFLVPSPNVSSNFPFFLQTKKNWGKKLKQKTKFRFFPKEQKNIIFFFGGGKMFQSFYFKTDTMRMPSKEKDRISPVHSRTRRIWKRSPWKNSSQTAQETPDA